MLGQVKSCIGTKFTGQFRDLIAEDSHSQFAGSISDHESLYRELKNTSQKLEKCKDKLNSYMETNARLTREMNNLHVELTNIKSACHGQHIHDDTENMDLCLDSPHSSPLPTYSMVNHDEEILNLQLEFDILKTILGEEKSARFELEKKATVSSLKRIVMEVVTTILLGGLRVDVVHCGKKVRDDKQMLLEAGLSHNVMVENLGFTLEPHQTYHKS